MKQVSKAPVNNQIASQSSLTSLDPSLLSSVAGGVGPDVVDRRVGPDVIDLHIGPDVVDLRVGPDVIDG
jgi:hypothetical protein